MKFELIRSDEREGLHRFMAERIDGQLRFWCDYCNAYHFHSVGNGHRVAHCPDAASPYRRKGYLIEEIAE